MRLLSSPKGFLVQTGHRYPGLDLLRTPAITLVMVRHFIDYTPDYLSIAQRDDWELWRFGVTGVDLFFVLSGFLIFSMLIKLQQTGRLSVKSFFVGRILRIWPAYFVSIFVITIFSSFDSLTHIPIFLAFLQNYVIESPHVNGGIYWTLAVEEHFYIFAPFLVILLSDPQKKRTITCFIALLGLPILLRTLSSLYFQIDLTTLTNQTHYRIDTIVYGVLIAYLFHHFPGIFTRTTARITALCLALILLPIAILSTNSVVHDPEMDLFIATIGISAPGMLYAAILFVVLSMRDAKLPGTKFFLPLAHLSYSMYLYHLFAVIMATFIFSFIEKNLFVVVIHFICFYFFTVILAAISYILVERPFLLAREAYRQAFRKTALATTSQ